MRKVQGRKIVKMRNSKSLLKEVHQNVCCSYLEEFFDSKWHFLPQFESLVVYMYLQTIKLLSVKHASSRVKCLLLNQNKTKFSNDAFCICWLIFAELWFLFKTYFTLNRFSHVTIKPGRFSGKYHFVQLTFKWVM